MDLETTSPNLTLGVTPRGHLVLVEAADATPLEPALAQRLREAFSLGGGPGLWHLGGVEVGAVLPAAFTYWRELGVRFITGLCTTAEGAVDGRVPPPPVPSDLDGLAAAAPPMPGVEYLTAAVLTGLWGELAAAYEAELTAFGGPLEALLGRLHPSWHVVGKVHFNLADNRKDPEAPFAFMATYTHRLAAHNRAQHVPLGQALREFAGPSKKDQLLSLLVPVQRAAERCAWLAPLVASGEIFHPLRWTVRDAMRFLRDVPELERAGVIVRMPATWPTGRPARARATATLGARPPSELGFDALLDFNASVTLDGEPLERAEIDALLAATDGLVLLRGQWVEVDRERLARTLGRFEEAARRAASDGLSFREAMRLVAGAPVSGDEAAPDPDWSQVSAGPWLAETLRRLRSPDALAAIEPGPELLATLRPYQEVGVRWLHFLTRLGLGACLADDMGLGKTLQVLALLVVLRRSSDEATPKRARRTTASAAPARGRPSLLVAPASLLGNWAAEVARFTPSLEALIAHPSATRADALDPERLAQADLVITSYGQLTRLPALFERPWRLVILDEAQAIKNPDTRQTRAVKRLEADARIALTGTPVENRAGDLWSLFDFINPGLLGSAPAFSRYMRALADRPANAYGPLRELVRPYLLRRLKTDRSVIADLPDKTELKAYCGLSRTQAALYEQAVTELRLALEAASGIQRKALVLTSLMRLKQICNHPSQWLGDGAWDELESGKWARLRELCETIAVKQEKVLVFTQFKELTAPLAAFLGAIFGRPGLVLHGETAVKRRRELVERFQADEQVPFFVLSLKAGGSGLTLTAASHVIHVDRWWNPAVEDQATDRAFRIGQRKNVLVHKFVCRGTIEEKIDALIDSKRAVSNELLAGGAELDLTALDDREILRLVALDLEASRAD